MSTFTPIQQAHHRKAFIEECRQKAWSAVCHADWIGKQSDELMAQYEKLSAEHRGFLAEIEQLKTALDSHTYDNRQKRKDLQANADQRARQIEFLGARANEFHKAMAQLHANGEQNLTLAKHAEEWEWKEVEAEKPKKEI